MNVESCPHTQSRINHPSPQQFIIPDHEGTSHQVLPCRRCLAHLRATVPFPPIDREHGCSRFYPEIERRYILNADNNKTCGMAHGTQELCKYHGQRGGGITGKTNIPQQCQQNEGRKINLSASEELRKTHTISWPPGSYSTSLRVKREKMERPHQTNQKMPPLSPLLSSPPLHSTLHFSYIMYLVRVDPPGRGDHLGPPRTAPAHGHATGLLQGQRRHRPLPGRILFLFRVEFRFESPFRTTSNK